MCLHRSASWPLAGLSACTQANSSVCPHGGEPRLPDTRCETQYTTGYNGRQDSSPNLRDDIRQAASRQTASIEPLRPDDIADTVAPTS